MQPIEILIVDDDLDDREMVEEAIRDNSDNVSIKCLNNGNEALHWLQENSSVPDFIFLDINMPQLNGMQCLKRIKQIDKLKKSEVIVYSTSNLKEDKRKALSLGASCFFSKPNDFRALKKMIGQVIRKDWELLGCFK